jgi:predicted Zn-dependent peptidase
MTNLISRNEISDGIAITSVIDSKFKTVTLRIKFVTKLDIGKVSANALAIALIVSSNSRYKTQTELSAKTDELYGASLFGDVSKSGNGQILEIGASIINNKYTFDNEDITGGMLEIIRCCLFEPNVKDGKFDEKEFKYRKKDLLDTIESEINNKRMYALRKAGEIIFENEPASYSSYGTRETVEDLTPQQVYSAYLELLRTAQIEIYYVASEEIPEIKECFADAFKSLKRDYKPFDICSASPLKSETARVTESLDVNQMKMVLAYKTDYKNKPVIKLMNTMLGGSPTSKLFENVREKMSLCYYCTSTAFVTKQSLIIDCGIEKENAEKAETAIIDQLEQMKKGDFTDENMENAVLSIIDSLKAIGDTPVSYINWNFGKILLNEDISIEDEIEDIKAVTREQIIECAGSYKLDTVYIMTGPEEE